MKIANKVHLPLVVLMCGWMLACGNNLLNSSESLTALLPVRGAAHTLWLDASLGTAVRIPLPAGTIDIFTTFENAHAGGDLDGVILAVWSESRTKTYVLTETPLTLVLPEPAPSSAFFVDREVAYDNRGQAIITVRDESYIVQPAQHVYFLGRGDKNHQLVDLAQGVYRVMIHRANESSDVSVNGPTLFYQTDEQSQEWPRGHSVYHRLDHSAITMFLP